MTAIVETLRHACLGAGVVNDKAPIYSAGFMVVVLILGSILINQGEATFMDTV